MPVIHCEWGLKGVETLRGEVGCLVIVDVLSFSTCVDVAVGRGAKVIPFAHYDDEAADAAAKAAGAIRASRTRSKTEPCLSPSSLKVLRPGDTILLPSPNGSTLSLAGEGTPVLCGSLRNARAVAKAARRLAGGGDIAVIPAGERWPDRALRPAVEDLIGAGAVIAALRGEVTAEALVALNAWRAADEAGMAELIAACLSGEELIGRGFPEDVELAVQQDASTTAPLLVDGVYEAA